MGIGSWWKKLRQREEEDAVGRADEQSHGTTEERRLSSESIIALDTDQHAAERALEPNIEDVDGLADLDDGPRASAADGHRHPLHRVVRVPAKVPGRLERLLVPRLVAHSRAQHPRARLGPPAEAPPAPGPAPRPRLPLG